MPSVKVDILRVVDDSGYPVLAECRLVDHGGAGHYFIDKLPVVADHDFVPPCAGAVRCVIRETRENTLVIDTSLPDDIESTDGVYIFEVNKDQVI